MTGYRVFAAGLWLVAASVVCVPAFAGSHFEDRMVVIKKDVAGIAPSTTATIVMLGDSITEGFCSSSEMPKQIDGLPVINEGIGGDNIGTSTSTVGVASRIDQVRDAKPAVVFLMIGINDLWDKKENADRAIRDYEEMFSRLMAAVPNAKIVVESVLPTRGNMAYTNPKILDMNRRIKELAAESGATWLDLHSVMKDDKGELKAEYTKDGVHLIKAGFVVWLGEIQKVADKLLK